MKQWGWRNQRAAIKLRNDWAFRIRACGTGSGSAAPGSFRPAGQRSCGEAARVLLISNVDDHLRNHGFLWLCHSGWSLSPAYNLNPVPTDLNARILSTNIDLDEGTCSLDLLEAAAGYFSLGLAEAKIIIKKVATVTATLRNISKDAGARSAEIGCMASAFEHGDLKRGRAL